MESKPTAGEERRGEARGRGFQENTCTSHSRFAPYVARLTCRRGKRRVFAQSDVEFPSSRDISIIWWSDDDIINIRLVLYCSVMRFAIKANGDVGWWVMPLTCLDLCTSTYCRRDRRCWALVQSSPWWTCCCPPERVNAAGMSGTRTLTRI